jgi:acyl-CoA synthetase (AMP-forming)/AMP-acid ligase II
VKEGNGSTHAPKIVEFVDELPMTAVGKVDKQVLRARSRGRRRPADGLTTGIAASITA